MFKRFLGAVKARELIVNRFLPISCSTRKSSKECVNKVISKDIVSPVNLPGFNRAAMDGFAVLSGQTRSANSSHPVFLEDFLSMRTGMQVPDNYDAVVMREDARVVKSLLEVTAEVHPCKNVSLVGEDIAKGDVVFQEGHNVRPADAALLCALGIESIEVYERPVISIIPTGSELVPIGQGPLQPGEAFEINSLMAGLYVEKWGGVAQRHEIVSDDPKLIGKAIKDNLAADLIIIIGGTSVGEKDYVPSVLAEMGELLVHGVRLQPGKPTAFGLVDGTPVVCLPGYPVAALFDLYLFVRPAIKKMAHLKEDLPKIKAALARKIPSRPLYLSMVRVALRDGKAEPIMISGAGILSSVARADGFVIVPEEMEGIEAGETVEVILFE